MWGVRGRVLSHPKLPALWAGCRGRCGASRVGRSPTPDCSPSRRAARARVGRPGSDNLPPPTIALWAGCWCRCGASGVGRAPTPDCPPSGRAAGAGVGRPGSGALPPPSARPLGGLPGPVWGVRGRALSHPKLPALWAGCRGRCGASRVGRSPTPDCSPSRRAAGAGVGRPGSGALPPPTARAVGGLPGPVWGVRGRTLSHPRLPALWAGCRGRCGASGVGRSPTPDCSPSGRAAGARVGRPGSDGLPPPTIALWAGCWCRCGASGVGRAPTPNCPPSGRAAGAGVGRPGSGALPPPSARPLGGLPGPVWGVRGQTLSHPRLPALWAGCWGRCGASGVGRSPTPECPPSGRATGAGVGRPGSDALPPPTAGPLGGLPGQVWGVRGRALSHPRLLALWAGCPVRRGASGVGRSPTPDCSPSGRAAGAGVGRPGSDALPPPTARPLGGLPVPVWGVRGRVRSHPRLLVLWAGCRGPCGASGVGRSPTPNCRPSGRAAGAGVGRPGSGALPTPTARPLGGLPGPVWGVPGRTLSHPRLPALWAGCRGRCGASGVGRSPTPDCPPSGRAAGAGVGRPGSDALPPPTAGPLGGRPGPVWGVRGRALSHPRLLALWAGCRGRCGASGVGRSPTPDCSPSGRAAGAGVGRPGSDALPPPTARPLGGLPVPVWGVRGRVRSHPRLLVLWAGCRGPCGASEVGHSPTPNCPPSGRAAGAGVGRPGSGALPTPTARPLGGLPGPVWGVRGRALSHPRLPALWAGCRGRCGASGVGRSPTPDCSPSGRAAGAGVGRPGSDALPPPTAHPLGGLPGPVWGVRGRALSHPRLLALWAGCRGPCGASGVGRSPTPDYRPLGGLPVPVWGVRGQARSHPQLPALWAGCRGRCGASGVGRSPTPECPPSGRAAGAGVGRPGSGALPPPTARPLGGLPGPVWGVRGRALSHPRLPALWAGCRGRCGASGVGRSPTPDCSPSGRAAGASVGRPGSNALPPPTARPLGGLPGPVRGVRGRALSHPRLPALWAGCRGRCGASGVGRSPTPNCSPSGRAAGAGVGRPGSGALPPPTARPLGGLPGPVWGVRGRTHSHPRLPALWAGCRCRCGASGVGRAPTPDSSSSGRAAGAGVGRPGSGALPPPAARPLGGLPGPVWGVQGRALSHPRLLALSAGCRGRCGASGVGQSPTPDCPPSGRAAGAGVGRPGSGALPTPTARPLGGLPGPVWGVRGRTLSHPSLPALWAGCRGRCGASGVGRSPTPDCSPSGRAAGARVGRPGSDALPTPTARPLGGLQVPVWGVRGRARSHPQLPALREGCRAAVRVRALLGRVGRAGLPGAFWCASPFLWPFLLRSLLVRPPPAWGCPVCGCCWVFLPLVPPPPCFFFSPPPASVRPVVSCFECFPAWGALGLGVLLPPPPLFVFFLAPPPPPCCLWRFLLSGCLWPLRPPTPFLFFFPFFFPVLLLFFPAARLLCVFWGVVLCVPCPARSLCCARRLCCFCWLMLLVPGVTAFCWGSAGGSGCPALSFGGVCRLWCPGLIWPSLGVLPVVTRSPVLCPVALCCRVVLCCGAPSSFFVFFVFLPARGASFLLFPVGSGLRAGSGSFLFLCSACAVLFWCACAVALCSVLSCPRGAGWCFVLLRVVFVCLLLGLAVLCCLLVGPGGSWCRVPVACCGVSLGAVLRRVAARCAAWRCVVVHCVVSFCSVWCRRAPCCVLGRCPLSWGPVPSGAVFCLVPPRCVCFAVVCRCVVLFAVVLCAVCALGCPVVRFLSSPPCAVLLCGPLSLGALLPCAVPRGAVLPRGAVVSCPAALLGLFLAWVWLYLLEKPLQNFAKYFFPLFLAFENKIKLYTTQHTRVQQDHVRCCALRATRRS